MAKKRASKPPTPSRLFFLQQRLPSGNQYIAEVKSKSKEAAIAKFQEHYGNFPGFAVWEIGPISGMVELVYDGCVREINPPKVKQKASRGKS